MGGEVSEAWAPLRHPLASCALCALVPSVPAVAPALVVAGAGWITVTSSLNGTAVALLPSWVRARGVAL